MPKDKKESKLKSYSVTLEKELVDEAKKLLEVGRKLSPILNHELKKWVEKERKIKELREMPPKEYAKAITSGRYNDVVGV